MGRSLQTKKTINPADLWKIRRESMSENIASARMMYV